MDSALGKKLLTGLLLAAALWLGGRYVLPVVLPFGLGALLALAAEPAVSFGVRKCRMPRGLASGIGVTVTVCFAVALIWLVAAIAIRELGQLAKGLPDLEAGTTVLKSWLTNLADQAPKTVQEPARRLVVSLFEGNTPLLRQVTDRLPGLLGSLVSGVGSSALGIGTGLLAAFLISARLPGLKKRLKSLLPPSWYQTYLPALRRLRSSLWGWLKAQVKLSAVTWGIVSVGFWVLGVPYFPLWAALVAVVDAIPILGTGTVLVPWALVCLLRGNNLRALGLLCIYGAAAVTRTALEPRLVGKHLGLDPLTTLIALYTGFRLWGIGGLLLTPILASAAKSLLTAET